MSTETTTTTDEAEMLRSLYLEEYYEACEKPDPAASLVRSELGLTREDICYNLRNRLIALAEELKAISPFLPNTHGCGYRSGVVEDLEMIADDLPGLSVPENQLSFEDAEAAANAAKEDT